MAYIGYVLFVVGNGGGGTVGGGTVVGSCTWHLTPTSSSCPHVVIFQGACPHSDRRDSVPLHETRSNKIGPTPAP